MKPDGATRTAKMAWNIRGTILWRCETKKALALAIEAVESVVEALLAK
jgi:hypothetical protein